MKDVFLCLLPLAYGILLDSLLNAQEIQILVDALVKKYGSDATEKQCESECLALFTKDHHEKGCDFACLSIQTLIYQKLHPPN